MKKIIAITSGDEPWSNTQLVKDCGLIPFLLYKNHNCDVTMVGAKSEYEYTNLTQYVIGLKMLFLENHYLSTKLNFIRENALNIDCLILYGFYGDNLLVADLYKKYNPNGKIYVSLDANSYWIDKTDFRSEVFLNFLNKCDIFSTSCHKLQQLLNAKWPVPVLYLQNGYYPFNFNKSFSFEDKNNTILTVGRIGTYPKQNEILLQSFSLIADKIPDWELKLVGNVDTSFEPFLNNFFIENPSLKNRIHFLGPIYSREKLYSEYYISKIFALTSFSEGGTPNVIAEALCNGCTIVTTKIDAYEDTINYGSCGYASERNDVLDFSTKLLQACTTTKLQSLCENAYKYGNDQFNMEKIVAKIYELIFKGE